MASDLEILDAIRDEIQEPIERWRVSETSSVKDSSAFWAASPTDFYQIINVEVRVGALSRIAVLDANNRVIRLYLNSCSINKVPAKVFDLSRLEVLFLYNPSGGDVFDLNGDFERLPELRAVVLEDVELHALPLNLVQLPSLKVLSIGVATGLAHPPSEIARSGIDAIRNYFESLAKSPEVSHLFEAKMVVVGRGFVGKTTLVKRLIEPDLELDVESELESTEGIDISSWDVPVKLEKSDGFRFSIWDFGGQEKYDATHQFFLTRRTLYLFVTEARQESNYLDFDYWLNVVHLLAPDSPILVVQNKIDQRQRSLPTDRFQKHFPNIMRFVDVSCAPGYGKTIDELNSGICEAIRELPQVGDELPRAWVDVRNALNALEEDHITYERYREICAEHGLSERQADHLSQYFHDLGVVVHYQQSPLLRKTVIINPDWAVDAVYAVLDNRRIENNQGRFSDADLASIWQDDRYRDKLPELLEIMENYELCFQRGKSGQYIATELLPANPPPYQRIKRKGKLTLLYRFEFMPAGMVKRFIAKAHNLIEEEAFWRTGVVLADEGTRAVIVENDIRREIRIDVGDGAGKKELLAVVRSRFLDVFRDLGGDIQYDEHVPCPCTTCRDAVEDDELPHLFAWSAIGRFASKGIESIQCQLSGESVSVGELRGEYSLSTDTWVEEPLLHHARGPGPAAVEAEPAVPASGKLKTRHVLTVLGIAALAVVATVLAIVAAPEQWQVIAAGALGSVFVLTLLGIAFLVPDPTAFQREIFRVVLALAAGGIGAILPGTLDLEFKGWIQAGGALAMFTLVYLKNPASMSEDVEEEESSST